MEHNHNGHASPLILSARDVEVRFNLRGRTLTAVRGASLDLYEGETLAIVGESGCGKSVFTKSFIGMLDKNGTVTDGKILYRGEDLTAYKTEAEWLRVRGKKIAMVFQDPMTSLNPVRTIGEQITEVITWHFGTEHEEAKREAIEILKRVGIADAQTRYKQYPNEFSGGMRQRVVIATAIACRPEILICDEPTTALDVTVQAQILRLIKDLQKELKMTVVYITHDLGVVANVADWVGVMYAGQIIEYGTVHEIFKEPVHPYTRALLQSLPQLGVRGHALYSIQGTPPSLFKEIRGDAFAPRNPDAMEIEFEQEPPQFEVSPTHWAKTWLLHPYAQDHRRALEEAEAQRRAERAGKHLPLAADVEHAAARAHCKAERNEHERRRLGERLADGIFGAPGAADERRIGRPEVGVVQPEQQAARDERQQRREQHDEQAVRRFAVFFLFLAHGRHLSSPQRRPSSGRACPCPDPPGSPARP